MRQNRIKDRFSHYVPLLGIYGLAIFAFYKFQYEKMLLIGITVALSLAYIAWGIAHHIIHKDVDKEIIFEYVGVSALGFTLLLTLIFRM